MITKMAGRGRYIADYDIEKDEFHPESEKAGMVLYVKENNKTYNWNGTQWVLPPGGGGGMEQHGNEWHIPDYEPANINIQAHVTSIHAPIDAQKNSDILKSEIETKLVGEITSHTHPVTGSQAFPVGSGFISFVDTNPNILLGYGTWTSVGAGKVLIGVDISDFDFNVVEKTGGAKAVQSSPQTFAGDAMPTHQHAEISAGIPAGTIGNIAATATAAVKVGTSGANAAAQVHTHPAPAFTGNPLATHQHTGISAGTPSGLNTPGIATSVVQPYITVYIWKRIA